MHIQRRSRLATYNQNTTAADAIVCKLCADITTAKDVEQRIRSGLVDPKHLADVRELERRAWLHMAYYLSVKAFVDDGNNKPD